MDALLIRRNSITRFVFVAVIMAVASSCSRVVCLALFCLFWIAADSRRSTVWLFGFCVCLTNSVVILRADFADVVQNRQIRLRQVITR